MASIIVDNSFTTDYYVDLNFGDNNIDTMTLRCRLMHPKSKITNWVVDEQNTKIDFLTEKWLKRFLKSNWINEPVNLYLEDNYFEF